MNDVSYERPREKLEQRGVKALNTVELLQVILGSGTKGYSVAKLARDVARLLERTDTPRLKLDELLAIKGLGRAKSLQLIAVQGLHERIALHPPRSESLGIRNNTLLEIADRKRKTVRYCLLDGAGGVIYTEDKGIVSTDHYAKIVRHMFSQALARGAYAVAFSIGSKMQNLTPSAYELGVASTAAETAKSLQIHLLSAYIVSPKGHTPLIKHLPYG